MREILFKAKRIDNGEWIEGYLVKACQNTYPNGYEIIDKDGINYDELDCWQPSFTSYEVDEKTICQYTGLTDKNGIKIWENDIVRCDYNYYGDKGIYVGKVFFREDTCTFLVTDMKSTNYEWWNEDKEVIGNIFDNPKLLGD